MLKKSISILILTLIFIFPALSQKMDFLPKNNIWQTQTLDPLATQSAGQMAVMYENASKADYYLAAFTFGFQRSLFAWPKGENKSFDLGFEGAAFTQFEWTDRSGEFQRNILSTDFMIGMPLTWLRNNWRIKLRVYHLSAHMGDDYMIRNNITGYYRNNNNYEQLDLNVLYSIKHWNFGLGAGSILRASQPRKALMFNANTEYRTSLNNKGNIKFYAAFYADARQDNDWKPAINLGTGLQFGQETEKPFKILFTYFNGPLPYSVYTGKAVSWFGLGFYINPF